MLVEFKIPDLGENIENGEIVKIMVKVGDEVKPEQSLFELETGKAIVEVPSEVEGRIAVIHVEEGDKVDVGQVVFSIETDPNAELAVSAPPKKEAAPPAEALSKTKEAEPSSTPTDAAEIPASPGVRRVAREMGVDLSSVKGSGPEGRITEEDVRAMASVAPMVPSAPSAEIPLPDFSRFGKIERKAMSSVRQATAEHLSHAWQVIPQVTQYDSADITELEVLRKRYAQKVEQAGGRLTLTAVLVKVVASALRQFPQFNTSVDMARREIIGKDYVNVGVAVDTERGLLVPVIRSADEKNITELAIELIELSKKAHNRQLGPTDLEGGTFSITNLGTVGGTHFSPIVNWPEVAILGISRAGMEPVWKDNQFVPRLMLQLSLSYDHRVIDGADGARFLRWICEALEQPFFMALEG
ncbi:2-oxo acid dehydrogenase subunit E2 [bacterium]|nr:2-oxo acid dehydrogenase subunit E2 [bacterium]MBU1985245.1 2-oxo acid dehydrogenase subunit E2 [bacterium]